jgi:hypothetical protein
MAGEESGYRWWIRYVIIPLIGGGGILGLWLALRSPAAGEIVNPASRPIESGTPPALHDQRAEVESVVSRWLAAWLGGDTDAFVSQASEPFYFDQKIILTRPALRVAFESLKQEKGSEWRDLQVNRIKVMTAGELQATGFDLSHDRIFGNLNLTLDDYAVQVFLQYHGREEGMLVVVRRGSPLRIVGLWD